MVSDLDTDPMIYWSESGDTFFGEHHIHLDDMIGGPC
jgi:hypothetical protein